MLSSPIKNYKQKLNPDGDITQWFGENPKLYAFMNMLGHNGIDIVRPHGEKMFAIEDGIVLDVKEDPDGYGKHVRFLSNTAESQGVFREWTYGHCATIYVSIGDVVSCGQHIADMGNTGFVVSGDTPFWKNNPYAGTHLHLGLRLMKRPKRGGWSYRGSNIKLDVIDYNNGFKGAIDPAPYLLKATDIVAKPDVKQLQMTVISLATKFINLLKKK